MIAHDIHDYTRRLADLLIATPVGDVVTLNAMTAAAGRDIRIKRYIFYSAAKISEREAGVVMAIVKGKGYRRMAPAEMPKVGQTARARTRGICRRANRTIVAGIRDVKDIPPDKYIIILAEQTVLGMLIHVSSDRNLPTIKLGKMRPLSVSGATREFLKKIGAEKSTPDAPQNSTTRHDTAPHHTSQHPTPHHDTAQHTEMVQ